MNKRIIRKITAGAFFTAALTISHAFAQSSYTWSGAVSGDWGNAANWDTSPVFAAANDFTFHSPGASNLATFMGSSPRTIGGLTFNGDADSDISVRTYSTSSGTGGGNRILTFDNGSEPVYIMVEAGAEGNIQVAPGNGRTVIKSDLIITHNGTGLLTYHHNNWLDDEGQGRYVFKEGPGTLEFGASGWKFGGGLVIHEGRVKILRDDAFGTGTLTMTDGALSAIGADQRTFTNNYYFSDGITLGNTADNGALTFSGDGTLTGNTTLNIASETTLSSAIGQQGGDWSLTKSGPADLALTLNQINTFAGGLNVEEGTLIVNNHENRLGTGPVTLDGGTLRYIGTSAHASIYRDLIIGEAGGVLELNTNDRVITWANPVSGGGTFTKAGVGPLVFEAVNTHTGEIVVAKGVLLIDGTHTGNGAITVQYGGTIGGSGSAAGACSVENGGTLDPGSSAVGTFTVGGLAMQTGSIYLWELDETSGDTVDVDGDLTLPSSFAVEVTQLTPTSPRKRVLFTYSGSYSGPDRADITATGDVDTEARYQALHDPQNKQVLFVRKPEPAIMIIR